MLTLLWTTPKEIPMIWPSFSADGTEHEGLLVIWDKRNFTRHHKNGLKWVFLVWECHAPYTERTICILLYYLAFNLLTFSVPDDGYFGSMPCVLHLISMFWLLQISMWNSLYVGLKAASVLDLSRTTTGHQFCKEMYHRSRGRMSTSTSSWSYLVLKSYT